MATAPYLVMDRIDVLWRWSLLSHRDPARVYRKAQLANLTGIFPLMEPMRNYAWYQPDSNEYTHRPQVGWHSGHRCLADRFLTAEHGDYVPAGGWVPTLRECASDASHLERAHACYRRPYVSDISAPDATTASSRAQRRIASLEHQPGDDPGLCFLYPHLEDHGNFCPAGGIAGRGHPIHLYPPSPP